jgi:hypothetical protein
MLMKLIPAGVNFTIILQAAFTLIDPESITSTVMSSVYFYVFGICWHKSCALNIGEIEPWSQIQSLQNGDILLVLSCHNWYDNDKILLKNK